jgi:hypothetical protein
MKAQLSPGLWLVLCAITLAMLGCKSATPTQTSEPFRPAAATDREATIAAQVEARVVGTPTATPFPPEDRALVLVELEATDEDASGAVIQQRFAGTWTLVRSGGRWLLDGAQIDLL